MNHKHVYRKKNGLPLVLTGGLALIFLAITVVIGLLFVPVAQDAFSRIVPLSGLGGAGEESSPYVERKRGQLIPMWIGTDRVTILLLGVDERQQEQGPSRTDTMMLLTLDPTTLQAGVLSLPRDLWVPLAGDYGQGRINTAYYYGEIYDYPGGGPALAMETVEYNLGVPVQYYLRINFQGFIELVDLIGGIDIYVEQTIDDPRYPDNNYGYDPLYIEAGQHHFDGEMALKYARTRHASNDFDRAHRQQQVLLAILDQITRLDILPQLATNADEIFATLEDSVSTDLQLDEMLALGGLALKVNRDEIRFGVLDTTCVQSWTTETGAQVEVPIRERVREVRDYIFGMTAAGDEQIVEQEAATLALLNGTSRPGLASTAGQYLQENGLTVARIDNADRQDYSASRIVLNRPKPATAAQLLELLGLPQSAVVNSENPTATEDIVVILGADYAGPPQ